MFLGKTVVHGICTLCFLSQRREDELATAAAVARAVEIPPEHARKVLTALTTAGLITSSRGRMGGYMLARGLDEITMLDALDALHPEAGRAALQPRDCPAAPGEPCRVLPGLGVLRNDIRQLFSQRTIAEVIGTSCPPCARHEAVPQYLHDGADPAAEAPPSAPV